MDRNALILMAMGRDRPGIVDRISGLLFKTGCNLEDSRMSILGGEFALMLQVTGEADHLARAESEFASVAGEMELMFQLKRKRSLQSSDEEVRPGILYRLHAVSMDHPGIVHKITHVLSKHGVNVAQLDTKLAYAPVTGTPVFSLELEAQLPVDLALATIRSDLNSLAEQENIDVDLRPAE